VGRRAFSLFCCNILGFCVCVCVCVGGGGGGELTESVWNQLR